MPHPKNPSRPRPQQKPRRANPSPRPTSAASSGRDAACRVLARHAERFPDLLPDTLNTVLRETDLDPREAAFARAIADSAVRRWLTLTFLLQRFTTGPADRLEPGVRAALLAGAAQLTLLDRVPPHAALHETVEWVKRRVRAKAAGLTNAVLRRIAEAAPSDVEPRETWSDGLDELPLADGRARVLSSAMLPEDEFERLGVVSSLPTRVVTEWTDAFGRREARGVALHAITVPPVILNAQHAVTDLAEFVEPHEDSGLFVYTGPREALGELLSSRGDVWVQDPGSVKSLGIAAGLEPGVAVDLCAGRGTKTRQLRAMFPGARIIATDSDAERLVDLRAAFEGDERVEVVEIDGVEDAVGSEGADLVLLDVPCSNSGVLARRPEARYRLGPSQTRRLVKIQDGLLARGAGLTRAGGHVVYATCSIEEAENEERAQAACDRLGLRLVDQRRAWPTGAPGGAATGHRDGGFAALLAR